jgi:AcrR family transcriptional regulator
MDHLRADARRNRDHLLSAADDAFRRDGVAASLDEIARSAGVGIGTLYRHFPTRNDLIARLVQVDLERVSALADELCADESSDVLARWLDELVRHTVVYSGLAETVAAAIGDASTFGRACERVHSAGARLVKREQQRGIVRADVRPDDIISLANAVASVTQGDRDRRRGTRLIGVLVDGVSAANPRKAHVAP